MLAFIDAAVIAYTRYDAPQRPACTEIMSWVADGRLSAATSFLVIEEVWHLENRGRPSLPEGTARAAAELFGVLLSVTPDHLRAALEYPPSSLGTADRLHAAVAIDAGCEGDPDDRPGVRQSRRPAPDRPARHGRHHRAEVVAPRHFTSTFRGTLVAPGCTGSLVLLDRDGPYPG